MLGFKLEIIDGEHGVAACKSADIPQHICSEHDKNEVTVWYWFQRDWLILNKDNPYYEHWKGLLLDYLQLKDLSRKELNDYAKANNTTFFDFINQSLRIRRKLYQSRKQVSRC